MGVRRHILIAVENLGGGGAERVALDLAGAWRLEDAQPVLLVASIDGAYRGLVPEAVPVVEVGVPSSPRRMVAFLRNLSKALAPYTVVGIISHMTPMSRMLLRAAALGVIKAPVVVVEHNNYVANNRPEDMPWWKWRFLRAEIRWLYGKAAAVVGVSGGVTRQVGRLFAVPPGKLTTILNPLSNIFVAPPPPDPVLDEKLARFPRPWLVSVGRLVRQKGFADLLEAFARLDRGSLIVLGEGPLRHELERRAEELGITDRVFMPGFVTSPAQVLRQADLYVSSSLWEGYPLTLLEAYANGLPIVARACDFGPAEIIKGDRPGRLVLSQSIGVLAEAIEATLASEPRFEPGTRVDLSQHTPAHVVAEYRKVLAGDIEPVVPGKRLRVLMLIPQLGYGGAEGSFRRLATRLARVHDVRIAVFRLDYGDAGYSKALDLPDIPVNVLDVDGLGRASRWLRRWHRFGVLKADSDVVISFLSGTNLLNALVANHVPTVISERGSKRHDSGMGPFVRWLWTRVLDRIAYRRAHAVVAASRGLADEIVAGNKGISGKVHAIEGTIEGEGLVELGDAPVEEAMDRFSESPTMVFCGRLHHQKGLDFLLDAFAKLKQRIKDARLLVIGDGPEQVALRARCAALGLIATDDLASDGGDVFFAGFRDRPIRYLRFGRVFAFPSRYEGLPNGLIEAMAAGIPILAADCPHGPRSLLAGESGDELDSSRQYPLYMAHGGLLPPPDSDGSEATWVDALVASLNAPAKRRSREERLAAIARFDIEHTGEEWLDLIERLCA